MERELEMLLSGIKDDLNDIKSNMDKKVGADVYERMVLSFGKRDADIDCKVDRALEEIIKINLNITKARPAIDFYDRIAAWSVGVMITLGLGIIGLASYILKHIEKN